MTYGWFLRHKRSGKFVHIDTRNDRVTVCPDATTATRFDTMERANEAYVLLSQNSITFPVCEIIDLTLNQTLVPDADPPPPYRNRREHIAQHLAKARTLRALARAQSDLSSAPPKAEPDLKAPRRTGYGVGRF